MYSVYSVCVYIVCVCVYSVCVYSVCVYSVDNYVCIPVFHHLAVLVGGSFHKHHKMNDLSSWTQQNDGHVHEPPPPVINSY